jgi:hypothetical protein
MATPVVASALASDATLCSSRREAIVFASSESLRQLSEKVDLDRAEQGFRSPEAETELYDPFGRDFFRHGITLYHTKSQLGRELSCSVALSLFV